MVNQQQQPGGQRYVTDVRVRWSDLDGYGHVNNARTLTLLEEARVDWLFVAAAEQGVDKFAEGMLVARVSVEYRRAITFGSRVTATMWVSALRSASFTVDYELRCGDAVAVEASTMLVPVDPVTFRPRRLSEGERTYLTAFVQRPA